MMSIPRLEPGDEVEITTHDRGYVYDSLRMYKDGKHAPEDGPVLQTLATKQRNVRLSSNDKGPAYWESIRKNHDWIESLNSATNPYTGGLKPLDHRFNKALRTELIKVPPVIKKTIQENRADRPRADELWEKFQGLYLEEQWIPCKEQHKKHMQSDRGSKELSIYGIL